MEQRWPGNAIIPRATTEAVLGHDWLLGPFADAETGRVRLSFHAFCIEAGDERIVVDTCAGNDKVRPNFEALGGLQTGFLERMTEAGFGPDEVTAVVCTHLHVDHVGWNTHLVGDVWSPTFPRARYLFGTKEWAHWRVEPQVYGDVVGDSIQPCIDAGLAELVDSDLRLDDAVWLEPTPGHTPGHHSVRISSGGHDAVVTGDLVHHPVQFHHPDWSSEPDVDKALAITTRRAFAERYCDQHTIVLGTHFGGPSCGRLVAHDDGGWRLDPTGFPDIE
ncbi:MAG: MBL fold metallo-hydrolase [Acidimicrobiia bacterium]|nr:MBL fold metallo-hydrolase [Acidimicrobiia bacterium]